MADAFGQLLKIDYILYNGDLEIETGSKTSLAVQPQAK
ncbi:hypothetical protein MNBD_GAMMA21-98 [hydrothermal vent metagenome]|uniref:Uncharacterized protein n=1 Tax=hydrothermal vent metagenome TaxID=652676 RepID=A0A3B1AK74_9ZZZZ